MATTTFEDDGEHDNHVEVTDPDGVLNGNPVHTVTMPAPARPTDPAPARRPRRKSALGRPRVSPQVKNQQAAARSQGLEPGEAPAPMPEDMRDARVWWQRMLKEEFLAKGFAASDARIYVYREKAVARAGEKPVQLPPTIFGNQVEGHENQTAGDALVEFIMLRYHLGDGGARGPATYKLKCMNANQSANTWVGGYGTLDLEHPADIEQRLRRMEAFDKAVPPRAAAPAPTILPRMPTPPAPGSPPAMLGAPTQMPVAAPVAPGIPDFMQQMQQEIFGEFMAAWREKRAPNMPAGLPMPASRPEDEDAKLAKIAQHVVEALVVAGVISKTPAQAAVASTAIVPVDPITALLERETAQEKIDKLIILMARRRGMVKSDELPDVEVPAPKVEGGSEDDGRREGEGVITGLMRKLGDEAVKDPGKMFKLAGEFINSPVGNMLKDALLKGGVGLPNVGTAPGVASGGGFSPTT